MTDLTEWNAEITDIDKANANMLKKPPSRRSFTEGDATKSPARRSRSNTHSASFRSHFKRYGSTIKTEENSNKLLLFYCPEMEDVARECVALAEGEIVLGNVEFKEFPDGWPNLFIKNQGLVKQNACCFLASFHSPEVVFPQLSAIYALAKYRAREYKVIVPYFATGTMDRIAEPGEIATAMTMARLLSCIPPCATGPATLQIIDIHALQERFYFSDQVLIQLKSAIYLLLEKIKYIIHENEEIGENITIVFPDNGASKRFKSKFNEFNQVICEKKRIGDSRIVHIVEGTAEGKHCIIIDDLVQTGGTILQCAKCLLAAGAKKVSAYCTHAIFPKESYKKFLPDEKTGDCILDKFWITNTVPTMAKYLQNKKPFEVLSMAPVLCHSLLDDRINYQHTGISIEMDS